MILLLLACTNGGESGESSQKNNDSSQDMPASVMFAVASTTEATAVGFWSYDPSSENPVGTEHYRVTLAEAIAGAYLETPTTTQVLDPQSPGMTAAIFVPALLDAEDMVLGIGTMWPTWVEGEISESYQSMGLKPGWNAVEITPDHSMIFHDPLAMTLTSNLDPITSLALQGTAPGGDTVEVRNSEGAFGIGSIQAGAWSLTVSGTPAQVGPLNSLPDTGATAEILALQAGQSVASACVAGEPVQALFLAPTDSVAAGLERLRRGLASGWGLASASMLYVDAAQSISLQPSCP